MADEGPNGKQPIIVKRIKKGGHGHHGGAWKVAYADFVTAMMAFFLLLWLLNSVTEEQLQGISNYFSPAAVSESPSGAGGMLGGQVIGEGASESNAGSPTVTMTLPPSTIGSGGEDFTDPKEGLSDQDGEGLSEEEFLEEQRRREEEQFEQASEDLRQAIEGIPELAALRDSVVVDMTPEGLRIQIVDQEGMPMFPAGSAAMYEHTRALLELVARVVGRMPQQVAVSGHTDAGGLPEDVEYGKWELSADRALSSRRVLVAAGVDGARVNRVSGRADTAPLLPDDAASPRNRRISITLLREEMTGPGSDSEAPPLPSIINPIDPAADP